MNISSKIQEVLSLHDVKIKDIGKNTFLVNSDANKALGTLRKQKGTQVEKLYADIFKILGYSKVITTEQASKILDACSVDLMFLPVLAQIKSGEQRGMNPSKILFQMKERLKQNFPEDSPEQKMFKILIHHKNNPINRRRNSEDSLVTMTFEDFVEFLLLIAYPPKK